MAETTDDTRPTSTVTPGASCTRTDCLDFERAARFVDGALADDEQAAVAALVAECAQCRWLIRDLGRAAPRDRVTAEPGIAEGERYALGDEVARGGLGRVLRARDRRLGRDVAVKALLRDTPDTRRRFLREAHVTGRLQHPGIVPIYDAGQWPSGEPYYAMKLVSGQTLEACAAAASSVEERIALVPNVLAAAEAVAYAHARGVVHRDLKPQNVLVGEFGETVVIDWGLASAPDDDGDALDDSSVGEAPALTIRGAVLGTPAYMPPEQARGLPVDVRADVYALGAILYTVLAGQAPYRARSSEEILAEVQRAAPPPLREVAPGIPDDLAAIVERAMRRAPEERYASARELAADLRRFAAGRLVSARQYSPWALARRWMARHRALIALGSVAIVLLAILGVISINRIRAERTVARAERDGAEAARGRAEAAANELRLRQAEAVVERSPTAAMAWLETHVPGPDTVDTARRIAARALGAGVATHVLPSGDHSARVTAVDPTGRHVVSADREGQVWLWDLSDLSHRRLGEIGARPRRAYFSADGQVLSFRTAEGTTVAWEMPAGRPLTMPDVGRVTFFTRLPGGHDIVFGTYEGKIQLVDPVAGSLVTLADVGEGISSIASMGDGEHVVFGTRYGRVVMVPVAGGSVVDLPRHDAQVTWVSPSPDDRRLASVTMTGELAIHDLAAGTRRLVHTEDGSLLAAGFLAGGFVASFGSNGVLRVRNVDSGETLLADEGAHHGALDRSADGRRLIYGTDAGDIVVIDVPDGWRRVLRGHGAVPRSLVLSDDGSTVVSVADDGATWVWHLGPPPGQRLGGHDGRLVDVEVDADGAIVSSDDGGNVRVWDATGELLAGRVFEGAAAHAVRQDADGRRIVAVAREDGAIHLWAPASDELRSFDAHQGGGGPMAFAAGGRLVTGGADSLVKIWSPDAALLYTGQGHRGPIYGVHASPDGSRVATLAFDYDVSVWAVDTGARQVLTGHEGMLRGLAWHPAGTHLASLALDRTVRVWDLTSGEAEVLTIAPSAPQPNAVAFAGEGKLVVVGDEGGGLSVWDRATGEHRWLPGNGALGAGIAVAPGTSLVAIGDARGDVRLVDLATGGEAILRGHEARIERLRFTSAGYLVTADRDARVRMWRLADVPTVPGDRGGLLATIARASTAAVEADGRIASAPAPR